MSPNPLPSQDDYESEMIHEKPALSRRWIDLTRPLPCRDC